MVVSGRGLRSRLKTNPKDCNNLNLEKSQIITCKDCIYIPYLLYSKILEWYHNYLCHPGKTRMYMSFASNMY